MENRNWSEQMIEILNGLTDEQKEKVKACKSLDEIAACLGEMDVALPDDLLDDVSGGSGRGSHRVITPDMIDWVLDHYREPYNAYYMRDILPIQYFSQPTLTLRQITSRQRRRDAFELLCFDFSQLSADDMQRLYAGCTRDGY